MTFLQTTKSDDFLDKIDSDGRNMLLVVPVLIRLREFLNQSRFSNARITDENNLEQMIVLRRIFDQC